MPPEAGAVGLGLVWGVVCARVLGTRRAWLAWIWGLVSMTLVGGAAAVAAAPGLWGWRWPAGIAAAGAAAAGWLLRRMFDSMCAAPSARVEERR